MWQVNNQSLSSHRHGNRNTWAAAINASHTVSPSLTHSHTHRPWAHHNDLELNRENLDQGKETLNSPQNQEVSHRTNHMTDWPHIIIQLFTSAWKGAPEPTEKHEHCRITLNESIDQAVSWWNSTKKKKRAVTGTKLNWNQSVNVVNLVKILVTITNTFRQFYHMNVDSRTSDVIAFGV